MKRMIIAAMLLVSTVSVFATEEIDHKVKTDLIKELISEEVQRPVCEVSMEGSITIIGFSVKITCKASAATCKEAITIASKCLADAKEVLMES